MERIRTLRGSDSTLEGEFAVIIGRSCLWDQLAMPPSSGMTVLSLEKYVNGSDDSCVRTIQDLHYYGHPPGRACFELRILDF
jgi:hypothetical protein